MMDKHVKVNSKYSCTNISTHFGNPFEDLDSTQEKDGGKVNTCHFVH